ncbi:MAG TPA: dethiobiotin synthase [Puia sp.]|nr:dethiobiotin synthase [Puia sp.]
MRPFFISGIGTGIGKTFVAALLTEVLKADYWKPVQAGFAEGTDSETVQQLSTHPGMVIHPETYRLKLPASPHIAAREEGIRIDPDHILEHYGQFDNNRPLIIEGAGGLLVPLNESQTVIDLILALKARLILVSRNYLGSINHSLLSAAVCRQREIDVAGWVFNDQFMNYEQEIAGWSGIPALFSLPLLTEPSLESLKRAAESIGPRVREMLFQDAAGRE